MRAELDDLGAGVHTGGGLGVHEVYRHAPTEVVHLSSMGDGCLVVEGDVVPSAL